MQNGCIRVNTSKGRTKSRRSSSSQVLTGPLPFLEHLKQVAADVAAARQAAEEEQWMMEQPYKRRRTTEGGSARYGMEQDETGTGKTVHKAFGLSAEYGCCNCT